MSKETKKTETKKSEKVEDKKLSEEELKNTKGGGAAYWNGSNHWWSGS